MPVPSQSKRPLYGVVGGVIGMYWIVSICLVFLNKHIVSGTFGDEELTIFSAWFQSIAAVSCILIAGLGFNKCGVPIKLPKADANLVFSKFMILLAMCSVTSMTFNNLMLKHIGIAFYQVARSFTIIFTIILSSIYLRKGNTWRAYLACFFVVCGFVLGIDQEDVSGTLSVFGIIYGLLASFSAACSGILFKKTESLLDGDSLKLAYFNNINIMLIFTPLVCSTGQLGAVLESDLIYQPKFWLVLTFTGMLSLAIGWVSALQIKYTSPVAHHLSVNARSVVQTVIAVLYYHESKTLLWWLGNFLVVGGVLMYAFSKIRENSHKEALPSTTKVQSTED